MDAPIVSSRRPPTPLLLVLWLLAGLVLLVSVGVAPLVRTQEARVLLTGREMVGRPLHDWMVPTTNGEVRLRKPPLAYWLAAAVYSISDPNGPAHVAAGRLPFVLAGWGTIGVTFAIGSLLFDRRVGLLAAGTLLGSRLFFKFSLLAETDTLVMFFVTGGAWLIFRLSGERRRKRLILLQHGVAVCVAAAVLTKGPPGGYLLLLLGLVALVAKRRELVTTFFTSGAVVTAVVLALPWFVYVRFDPEFSQLTGDLKNSAAGGLGHSGSFLGYVPMLLQATLPWTPIWMIGLWMSARPLVRHVFIDIAAWRRGRGIADRWRRRRHADATSLLLLACWGGSVLVPLAMWGNKQLHYLMPAMPAAFVLVGWWLDRWLNDTSRIDSMTRIARHATGGLLAVFAGLFIAGGVAVIFVGGRLRDGVAAIDVVTGIALVVCGTLAALSYRRFGRAGLTYHAVGLGVALVALGLGRWAISLDRLTPAMIAAEMTRQFPDARWVFRDEAHLPLAFELNQTIPVVRSGKPLPIDPGVVLIDTFDIDQPHLVPPGWVEVWHVIDGESVCRLLLHAPDEPNKP